MENMSLLAVAEIAMRGKIELTHPVFLYQVGQLDETQPAYRLVLWAKSVGWRVWFTLMPIDELGGKPRQTVIVETTTSETLIVGDGSMELHEHAAFAIDFVATKAGMIR